MGATTQIALHIARGQPAEPAYISSHKWHVRLYLAGIGRRRNAVKGV